VTDGAPPGLDREAPQREETSRKQPTHETPVSRRVTPLPEPETGMVTASSKAQSRAL
tara:strand:+ start:28897 stop:29067 length:171 start_codon:yes stop_codon:yes gene_type:complete